jgi:hypothetical protein
LRRYGKSNKYHQSGKKATSSRSQRKATWFLRKLPRNYAPVHPRKSVQQNRPEQNEGCRGHSAQRPAGGLQETQVIATLRIILEQSLEWNSPLFINFVDYEKTFDSLDRETLWKLLTHYGIPDKLTNIIRNSYKGINSYKGTPAGWYIGNRSHTLLR